jgi:poly-gamma-glutamate capsule biosynthesis protein CapA/YwtB (metallophosphatase superfamily)
MSKGTIKIILVGGDSQVDKFIQAFENGNKTHVAGVMFGSVLESLGVKSPGDLYPGVWLHDPNKYDGNHTPG